MKKVVPYEHRGKEYRQLIIRTQADASAACHTFLREQDPWLKKIVASKLLEATGIFSLEVTEDEIKKAMECRIE